MRRKRDRKAYRRGYFLRNRERQLEQSREYYSENKEERVKTINQWRKVNPEKVAEIQNRYNRRLRQRVIKKLGSKCVKCDFSDWRALQVDHINGGGSQDRKKLGGTWYLYQEVLKDENSKFQLLCANCNWIKKVRNREI